MQTAFDTTTQAQAARAPRVRPALPAADFLVQIAARIVTPVALALIVFSGIWLWTQFSAPPRFSRSIAAGFVLNVLVLWQLLPLAAKLVDRLTPRTARPFMRLLVQTAVACGVSIVYSLLLLAPVNVLQLVGSAHGPLTSLQIASVSVLGCGLALAWVAQDWIIRLYLRWHGAQLESEALTQAALRAELHALRAQVNPHFLFNSLNTLYGMIDEQPERARELVIEMSDVFRYALAHGHRDLVPLSQELDFLDAFCALLIARHGTAIAITREIGADADQVALPPMTLQLLVENAVKHNRAGLDEPLHIRIERRGTTLAVTNTHKPRRAEMSGTGTGLRNINERCRLLAGRGIQISNSTEEFCVIVPLVPCSP